MVKDPSEESLTPGPAEEPGEEPGAGSGPGAGEDLAGERELQPEGEEEGFRSGFVSIVGRPNAGKSTLLNRILEQKVAIVSPVPQTTRHRIVGVLSRPGYQIVFVDTPGIHKPEHEMNRRMLKMAYEALEDVEVVLLMVDATAPFGAGDRFVIERLRKVEAPLFLVLNKVDLVKKSRLLPLMERYSELADFQEIVPVSAETGDGVDLLLAKIREALPLGPRYYPEGHVTDLPTAFLVSEMVREQVLRLTRQEVPHSTAVVLDQMEEDEDSGVLVVRATIIVEKENQKSIVIGRKGTRLKQIGTAARRELEQFLDRRIYLDLWVKSSAQWRENSRMLDHLLNPETY